MTPAETRLIKAAIAFRSDNGKLAWERFIKAIAAVVKERKEKI
jgi:hypothetical protein